MLPGPLSPVYSQVTNNPRVSNLFGLAGWMSGVGPIYRPDYPMKPAPNQDPGSTAPTPRSILQVAPTPHAAIPLPLAGPGPAPHMVPTPASP